MRKGLVVIFVVPVVLSTLIVSSVVRSRTATRRLLHTQEILTQLDAVLLSIANAETGVRGYVITGDPSYLQPFTDGVSMVHSEFSDLTALTTGNTEHSDQIVALRTLIDRRLVLLRHLIQLRQHSGWQDASAFMLTDAGKDTMDEIRARIAAIRKHETASRDELERAQRRSENEVLAGLAAGLILVTILLFRFYRSLERYATERDNAEFRLRQLNATLERQVQERTEALQLANARLSEQAEELARSNADLERYAYAAAHDLQEPSRTVAIFSQLVRRRYESKLNDDGVALLGLLHEDAIRMNNLVGDLLSYSRAIHDPPEGTTTDAEAALGAVLASLQRAIEKSRTIITHDRLPVVAANRQHLEQVLYHLVSNAIKFSNPGSRVHVGVTEEEDYWRFSVSDEGIGIPPEYHERIFVIFQRLSRAYKGSGVGLALCKRVVERHGGRIGVVSAPGKGSTFWFTLPRRRGDLRSMQVQSVAQER